MSLGAPTITLDTARVNAKPGNVRVPYIAWEAKRPGVKFRLVIDEKRDPANRQIFEMSETTDALGVDVWKLVEDDDRDVLLRTMGESFVDAYKRGRTPIVK